MPPAVARARPLAAVCVLVPILAVAAGAGDGRGHLDNPMLPEGCGSCHVGHGLSNQPMLDATEERLCYRCHGDADEAERMRAEGRLAPEARPARVRSSFDKPYRHPVERAGDHRPAEELPSLTAGESARHAECVDCHSPHTRGPRAGRPGVSGYSAAGTRLERATLEYEVCFKCHADLQPGGEDRPNLRALLGPMARSSHPVVAPRSRPRSPSLYGAAGEAARMTCSDCHGDDDTDAPRGPHGSNYRGLLVANYDTSPEAVESPWAFDLCYRCHSRKSIWRNESFPRHREHVLGDPARGIPGTSCATCHDAHGSLEASHLISFNRDVVAPDDFGRLRFVDLGDRRGACYLVCHNQSHSPARY